MQAENNNKQEALVYEAPALMSLDALQPESGSGNLNEGTNGVGSALGS